MEKAGQVPGAESILHYEQFQWFESAGIQKDEIRCITALLSTGLWQMVWDGERHAYILERKSSGSGQKG